MIKASVANVSASFGCRERGSLALMLRLTFPTKPLEFFELVRACDVAGGKWKQMRGEFNSEFSFL